MPNTDDPLETIRDERGKKRTFRSIGNEYGISPALVWKICNDENYTVKDRKIRKQLGLTTPTLRYTSEKFTPEFHAELEAFREAKEWTKARMVREGLRLLLEHEG